jgi:protein N-terminal glutamine amidohydrolase
MALNTKRTIAHLSPSHANLASVKRYTAFYCEENVWHLANDAEIDCVVFISNPQRQVACFEQQRAPAPGQPMVWDYHVIGLALSTTETQSSMIQDLDSALTMPSPVNKYLAATFPPLRPQHQKYSPWFRICSATDYIRTFASDRRHMKSPDGSWQQPPPAWPCIGAARGTSNLDEFLDLSAGSRAPGVVLASPSYEEFIAACIGVDVRGAGK